MKVIDLSPKPPQGNSIDGIFFQIRKIFRETLGMNRDIQAQDSLIAQLGKGLNNRFTLIRNFCMEDSDVPIPLILIGPTGLYVIYSSALKGVYQAKNENWSIVSSNKKYEPARPNLITRTTLMTRAVETYLKKKNLEIPDIQGVLFFSSPGIHVDSQRPSVRIVLMDGVDRFVTSVLQGVLHYERDQAQDIAAALTGTGRFERSMAAPVEIAETPQEVKKIETQRDPILAKNIEGVSRRFPLSPRQWILLGIMAFVEIIILITFIIIVLVTA